ncbi:hypothetical protein TWF106_003647 [Orbilia oligospora]|uniref:Uncharacterized protein n=1 Tax=Orbilia oligospora TaxID=2813651 RepID=A0A7C8V6P9_ORBOL|nr:hypothetical protein TWF106_003647 [Orbilia oligospora]
MENEWSKYAEKGIGTVVVHENLTSVKLFEVLFNISVSYTKTLTRKSSLDMYVEMGIEFAVEEKNMKWTKFVEKRIEPANAHGTLKCLVGSGPSPLWAPAPSSRAPALWSRRGPGTAVKILQLAGASRRDFLQRKKIAGEPISGGKVEMEEEDVGEE